VAGRVHISSNVKNTAQNLNVTVPVYDNTSSKNPIIKWQNIPNVFVTATKRTQQSCVLHDIMHISEHSFGHSYSPSLTQGKLILDILVRGLFKKYRTFGRQKYNYLFGCL